MHKISNKKVQMKFLMKVCLKNPINLFIKGLEEL
jgi:hypothetical protein